MVGILILTHGELARVLLAAAEVIAGKSLGGFEALALDWNDGREEARAKIRSAVDRLDTGEGVLILTDMYGGTPSNLAQEVVVDGRVELICGVNLPMVLRLGCRTGSGCEAMAVTELAGWLEGKGQQSVRRVRDNGAPCRSATPLRQCTDSPGEPTIPSGAGKEQPEESSE